MALGSRKLQAYVEKNQAIPGIRVGGASIPDDSAPAPEPVNGLASLDTEDIEAIGQRVQNGDGDPALLALADGMTEENNPAAWVVNEDIWEKAKKAVEPYWDEYDSPYAVVTHVYKAMGGTVATQ